VDVFHDFKSEEELDTYLDQCELIGVGTNAVVFLLPSPEKCDVSEILFRIEIENPVGYEWTNKLINKLLCEYPSFASKLMRLLKKIDERVKPRSTQKLAKECRQSMKRQIAGHNAAFRRNPLLTMPINSYYTFQEKWLGIRVKYFNGVPLAEAFPQAVLSDYAYAILKDPNPNNVVVGITNSTVREALIDIWDFTASDSELGVENSRHLYKEPLE
jgi:hypothetical protein